MIIYENSGVLGGWSNLTRVHGSAAYKVVIPAATSTGVLVLYNYVSFRGSGDDEYIIQHPYTIGAFLSFFSFLLTFRLSFAYGRYWEGATAVHQMLSKWLDCAMCLGAFHYQSLQFIDIRPPTFGEINDTSVTAERIKGRERNFRGATYSDTVSAMNFRSRLTNKRPSWRKLVKRDSDTSFSDFTSDEKARSKSINSSHPDTGADDIAVRRDLYSTIPIPTRFQDQFLKAGSGPDSVRNNRSENRRKEWLVKQSRPSRNLKNRAKLPSPSMFLQETAHLLSLLSAVALSTLRNDIDKASSPIVPYVPGMPWPCPDADELSKEIRREYGESNSVWTWVYYLLGLNRSQKHRTLYNAARPFAVLGGVSDSEITMLQNAHGPYAKVALCTMWLQEFITREYLAGSTGDVAAPILSRLYQFISDGFAGYNRARMVAYIPFPFPHGQVTSFFALAVIFIFPLLFSSFVHKLWFGCVMNFLTVLCFLGLHEVARELEQPFQNVPNDLPLLTFQAQLNEALVTMYAGFHPDSWWEVAPELEDVEEDGDDSLD